MDKVHEVNSHKVQDSKDCQVFWIKIKDSLPMMIKGLEIKASDLALTEAEEVGLVEDPLPATVEDLEAVETVKVAVDLVVVGAVMETEMEAVEALVAVVDVMETEMEAVEALAAGVAETETVAGLVVMETVIVDVVAVLVVEEAVTVTVIEAVEAALVVGEAEMATVMEAVEVVLIVVAVMEAVMETVMAVEEEVLASEVEEDSRTVRKTPAIMLTINL